MATILIGGGGGMIGYRLSQLLRDNNHEVLHLSRSPRPHAFFPTYQWDVDRGYIDKEAIRRADYVVNLAGAGIADKRWTKKRKKLIIDSRVDSTRLFLSYFRKLDHWPQAFLSGAAIGYYGDRGKVLLHEEAGPGEGFLSSSCQEWEAAIQEVAASGLRTVTYRIGIVVSSKGGALPKMMLPLRFHIGAYFGSGEQYYSWIHIDDLCRLFVYGMEKKWMTGTFNAVAPGPVTNRTFIQEMGKALDKPMIMVQVPAFALRLALGEMADTVLDSTRVSSQKIEKAGYRFEFTEVKGAVENVLNWKV